MAAPDVVVLSPHLDDAVLAVGGLVARLADEGLDVEVRTVFTGSGGASVDRWAAYGDYPTRVAEDRRALAVLGARAVHLGLPERIRREPRPRTLLAAFRGPADASGFGRLADVRALVDDALATGASVLAPLGVGGHVDHLELAVAALAAVRAAGPDALARAGFYEDPYALSEHARRTHPVTGRRPLPRRGAPGLAAPRPGLSFWALSRFVAGRGLATYVPDAATLPWRCEAHPVDGVEDRKLAAVAEYASQLPGLGGRRGLTAALRRGHATRGGELVWRLSPDGA